MSKLDQFESVFKSAAKAVYQFDPVPIDKVMVLTDLEAEQSRRFTADTREFLKALDSGDPISWSEFYGQGEQHVGDLLELIEQQRPDLICTYRNLHGPARDFPFSLGAYIDVLTQAITTPVLLLPVPTDQGRLEPSCKTTEHVMVLTDQLTGSDRLVNYGTRFTAAAGTLVLAHLEDDTSFNRYIEVISKIPAIETDLAREAIEQQLRKEPDDFIESCRSVLAARRSGVKVQKEVVMGHRISDCKQLVQSHGIDLMVLNTKDEDQLAMHGLAYPLAIELRHIPLLML